jgi:ABC-type transport system substrate-binding protein
MQLFYSKNIGQTNTSCTDIPEYDRLYEKASKLPDGPERTALWVNMARLLEYYGAIRVSVARNRNMVMQSRVIGFKKHPILLADWLYIDIDDSVKEK